jgi:methionyl-tRNA synthetase
VNKKFYVTTPIYYVTAKPHLGSLYSTLLADVIARWKQLSGYKTYFVTGTDEHGQKVARAAQAAEKEPQKFVDSFIPAYQDTWKAYNIAYDQFVRTSSHYHIRGAQQLVTTLLEKGDIYVDVYEGWYCTPCETFVAPKNGTVGSTCPTCNRDIQFLKEQTYFFRLSAYQQQLLAWYATYPDFITPKERLNEVISFVEGGLKDLSISRTTVPWGVPFPGDPEHTIYVWVEALCNYITAVGYGDPLAQDCFNAMWPADLHVIGKDIVKFHAVYWPALLMAAELSLPKRLLVHCWITVDHAKMSKSRGNVIDPLQLQQIYGTDEVRYYLMRHLSINQDSDFSTSVLEQTITSDLANTLGNLFNRMTVLAHTHAVSTVQPPASWSAHALQIHAASDRMIQEYEVHMQDYYIHLALAAVMQFAHTVNAYFHSQEPWKMATENTKIFSEVTSVVAHSVYTIACLLLPIMPQKMHTLLRALGISYQPGIDTLESMQIGRWHHTFTLTVIEPLFAKMVQKSPHITSVTPQKSEHKNVADHQQTYIHLDDILKVALHVGTITNVQEVKKSEKLLNLTVDFGNLGMRTILAGIKHYYTAETLVGTQAVFVCNLTPRIMAGVESAGMMLMAKNDAGIPQVIRPISPVPNGTRLS